MRMSEMAEGHDDVTRDDGYIKIRAADAKPGQLMKRNCAPDAEILLVDANDFQVVIYKREPRRPEEREENVDETSPLEQGYEETSWSYRPGELIEVRPLAA